MSEKKKKVLDVWLHRLFLVSRGMTLGTRVICYDIKENSVILVKHRYSGEWALPGGGIEHGESALDAAKRELLEEANVTCQSLRLWDIYHNKTISRRDHFLIFYAPEFNMNTGAEHRSLEIEQVAQSKLEHLPLNITACTAHAIESLAAHLESEKPK